MEEYKAAFIEQNGHSLVSSIWLSATIHILIQHIRDVEVLRPLSMNVHHFSIDDGDCCAQTTPYDSIL